MRSRNRVNETAEQLRQVLSALRRRLRAEAPGNGVPYPQLLLLRRLEAGPATTADLARLEHVTPQSAGATVASLEARGYVRRKEDAGDGRRRVLMLTAAGRQALDHGRAARQSWLAAMIEEHLDADEQRTLAAALPLLKRIAEA